MRKILKFLREIFAPRITCHYHSYSKEIKPEDWKAIGKDFETIGKDMEKVFQDMEKIFKD